jgi:peptidyl-prolyl cis-trans isomerase D
MGLSPAQLEENFRRQMRVVRLTNMIQDGALVSEAEIERDFRETNEKIKLEYIQVPPDAYSKQVNVTEERIQEIYAKEKASFMNPQRYSLTLVVLDEARTAQGIAIPESALRAAYDQNPARFRDEPRADVRHILLSTQGKNPAEIPAIEAKMADIVKKLRGGADFAALAKQFSEDPGSKDKGGLYENVPPKMMVPAFDSATFNQKVGEIGGVVRTDFGLHVLQVMKRTDARQRTFEEVRDTLRAELASQQASARMLTNANELRANLAKSTANLDELARRYNAALIPIDKQVLNGNYPEIGFNNEIGTAVVTMKPGSVGTVMTGQNGRLFIPILRESIPPAQMTLEEARTQIRTVETTRQAVALQTRKTQELADRAKQAGASFEALAKEFNAVYKSPDSFGRFGALEGVGSAATVLEAFKLPAGGVLGPMLLDGKQHVFRVVAREDADISKLPAERQAVLERVKTRKSRERGDVFEDGLVNELLRRGEAKIYPGAKEKVTAFFQ